MIAVRGRRLAKTDPAALAEHRFLAPQLHFPVVSVDEDEGAVRGLIGDPEIAMAPEDARMYSRGARAGDDDVVRLVTAQAHRTGGFDHEHVAAIGELQIPLARAAGSLAGAPLREGRLRAAPPRH